MVTAHALQDKPGGGSTLGSTGFSLTGPGSLRPGTARVSTLMRTSQVSQGALVAIPLAYILVLPQRWKCHDLFSALG
jgi:hypothetical protein